MFDNDGTLWCEKPMPIQLDFILRRFAEMAEADPSLRERQPWKAACERDYAWLGKLMEEHYAGDDTNVRVLAGGILAAYDGMSVEEFEARSDRFLRDTRHPTLGRGYLECVYAPMLELLDHLAANGFTNYIASGGGRDFMRPISQEVYGIPRQRVIGSSAALSYTSDDRGGTITHKAGAGLPRRRPREARPDLEPHGPPAAAGGRQLQRRRPDAGLHPARGQAVAAAARAARRPGAGVRLHRRGRAGARAGGGRRLDRRQRQGRLGHRLLTARPRRCPRPRPRAARAHGRARARDPHPDRGEHVLELLAILLLGLTTLATAWSGYQAARWSGEQSQSFARASTMRIKSQAQSTLAGQLRIDDLVMFNGWLDAREARRPRARRDLPPALPAGLRAGVRGLDRPSGPSRAAARFRGRCTCRSTGSPETARAAALDARADELYRDGTAAKTNDDHYILSTLFFAAVLFFAGISLRLAWRPLRYVVLGMAAVMLLSGVVYVLTLPVA